jgi:hypothetical protein
MLSLKQLKLAEKSAAQQRQVVVELNTIVRDIERCDKTINDLKLELEAVNTKHAGRRTTRDDIAYLTALLDCAKKKLAWEKQIASLHKRTPEVLERMNRLINDPVAPMPDELRAEMLSALQRVQAAMEHLQSAKVT